MRRTLDPKLDIVFKLLFGSPESSDFLVSLLSSVLMPASPITSAEVLDPEVPKEAVADKGIVLDIKLQLADGTLVDVEMQVERRPAFRRRALYYWARMFGAQLNRGDTYRALRPAVLVVFLDYEELAGDRLHSTFKVMEKADHTLFSDMLELHLIELPKLGRIDPQEQENEPSLVKWARFLAADDDEELSTAVQGDESMEKAKSYLDMLSAKPEVRKLAEIRELAYKTYQLEIHAAKDEGREEGREEGQRELLLKLVEQRFGPLSSEHCQHLESIEPNTLAKKVLTAKTLDELLES
jgi:predicted transposase/invertase (TIGR01784 family)